jgi:D-arabinose 1-dehydrogenase-like Zn-dependent alcohol dehydrogenase
VTNSVSARLSFGQAAVVALSGLAALQGLRAGRIAAGQKVLIIGTSGGIGTYAVQLANGLRRQGHRRGQQRESRSGPLDRRRRGHRLHAGGISSAAASTAP